MKSSIQCSVNYENFQPSWLERALTPASEGSGNCSLKSFGQPQVLPSNTCTDQSSCGTLEGRCYPSLNSTVTFPFPDRLPCDLWPPDLPGLTSATSPLCVCGLPGPPYSAAAWKLAREYRTAVRDDAQGLAKPDGQHCENCCIMYKSRFPLV